MYRYGDGSPFPLDENFIETLTAAVETCTNAFLPLTELDQRKVRAKEARREGDMESARLAELEKAINGPLGTFLMPQKKVSITETVAQKLQQTIKATIVDTKRQIDQRVSAVEAQALPRTATDAVLTALGPFFEEHQLPKSVWIMSWDVRGSEPHADAVGTAGPITAHFKLSPEQYRGPIRVDSLADGVIVHMMKKGMFGKAKPAPVDLGKYVLVAFEKVQNDLVVTLKENPNKSSAGLRFAVREDDATWITINAAGDAEGEPNDLDPEDVRPIKKLADRANAALESLLGKRTLVDLHLNGRAIADLDDPRLLPMELLAQLTPLSRAIRDKSRMSGELVLKRDMGDGRREELFVPRATLAQQFARLPFEYRKPFEDMGITGEETQPSIQLPIRPPAPTKPLFEEPKTAEYDMDSPDQKTFVNPPPAGPHAPTIVVGDQKHPPPPPPPPKKP
ncbi:MAG: hypothetical protein ACKV2T_05070 [Kofleriaceae bacterium]